MSADYNIGWDVGAWSCKTSSKSCDALVVLNKKQDVVGSLYRNSLRDLINSAKDTSDFLSQVFKLCELGDYQGEKVCLAIDTPLGYSKEFIGLISNYSFKESSVIDQHSENPYLYRKTERHLFAEEIFNPNNRKIRPLSAVNDMIGAQSTKGILVIAKFAPHITSLGVWESEDKKLTVIETYPAVNFEIDLPKELKETHQDIQDAYRCARIAYLFQNDSKQLVPPSAIETNEDDLKEGWIWYLKKEKAKNN